MTLSSVLPDAVKLNIKAVANGVRVTAAWVDAIKHITINGTKLPGTLKRVETECAKGAAMKKEKNEIH